MNIQQTTIHPTGINRDASTTDASHCEAILGLRPNGNTWHAANDKSRYQPDCQQDGFSLLTFHQHILPSGTQLIALRSHLSGQREKVNLYTATIDHTAITTSNDRVTAIPTTIPTVIPTKTTTQQSNGPPC